MLVPGVGRRIITIITCYNTSHHFSRWTQIKNLHPCCCLLLGGVLNMHIDVESIVVNLYCLDEPSSLAWGPAEVGRWTQGLSEAELTCSWCHHTHMNRKR